MRAHLLVHGFLVPFLSQSVSPGIGFGPKFYQSLILAWLAVDGSYSAARSSLVMASGHTFTVASSMSAKSCYVYLLSESYSPLHCVLKFSYRFGNLYWSTNWHQLSLFSLDWPVIDLSWNIAHGVLYTAARLFFFGLNYGVSCFCRLALRRLSICFFLSPCSERSLLVAVSHASFFFALFDSLLPSCIIWLILMSFVLS